MKKEVKLPDFKIEKDDLEFKNKNFIKEVDTNTSLESEVLKDNVFFGDDSMTPKDINKTNPKETIIIESKENKYDFNWIEDLKIPTIKESNNNNNNNIKNNKSNNISNNNDKKENNKSKNTYSNTYNSNKKNQQKTNSNIKETIIEDVPVLEEQTIEKSTQTEEVSYNIEESTVVEETITEDIPVLEEQTIEESIQTEEVSYNIEESTVVEDYNPDDYYNEDYSNAEEYSSEEEYELADNEEEYEFDNNQQEYKFINNEDEYDFNNKEYEFIDNENNYNFNSNHELYLNKDSSYEEQISEQVTSKQIENTKLIKQIYEEEKRHRETEEPKNENIDEVINKAAIQWHMIIPKNRKHKEEIAIYQDLINTLQRKILPYDINSNAIRSFCRYKGMLLGIANQTIIKNNNFILFSLIPNNIKLSIKITKSELTKPDTNNELLTDANFNDNYNIEMDSPQDYNIAKAVLDNFIKRMLNELYDKLSYTDSITLTRSGIFISCNNIKNSKQLEQILSILFLMSQNLKNLKR